MTKDRLGSNCRIGRAMYSKSLKFSLVLGLFIFKEKSLLVLNLRSTQLRISILPFRISCVHHVVNKILSPCYELFQGS